MMSDQPRLEAADLVRLDVRDDPETGERVVETWDYRRGGYTELKRWSP